MPKKYYPGGFRLTKKTAAALAARELGTARGLEHEPGMPEGYFHITFGSLDVRIFPDASDSSHRSSSRLIQMSIDMDGGPERIARFFNPDTLEPCTGEEEVYITLGGEVFTQRFTICLVPFNESASVDM